MSFISAIFLYLAKGDEYMPGHFQVQKPGISFGTKYTPGLRGTTGFTANVAQAMATMILQNLPGVKFYQRWLRNSEMGHGQDYQPIRKHRLYMISRLTLTTLFPVKITPFSSKSNQAGSKVRLMIYIPVNMNLGRREYS